MEDNQHSIRVLLADDHEMMRRGVAVSLLAFDDIEVVGEAANGAEAVRRCAELQPEVVLMDLRMPEMDGVQAIRHIRREQPDIQIIVLTSFKEKDMVESALKAGAIGYLLKDVSLDALAGAIRAAAAGKPTLATEATQALINAVRQPAAAPPGYELTEREQEVLVELAKGLSNPQIAARLGVSRSTINTHVGNILSKLGASSRTEAVRLAIEQNLLPAQLD